MKISAFLRLLTALLITTLLAACNSHNGFSSSSKAQSVGPAGDTITLTDKAGNEYVLTIPAGAVDGAKSFKITTLKPGADQLFRIKLEPENLLFLDGKEAVLTIVLPAGKTFPASGGFIYNGATIPFVVSGDQKTITINLKQLFGTASATTGLRVERMLARAGDFLLSRAAAAATAAQCGSVPTPGSEEEGLSAELNIDVQMYADCMQGAISSLQANGLFADALKASLAIAQLRQQYGNDAAALAAIASASQSACSIYEDVLTHLTSTPVDDFGKLAGYVSRAMYWESVVQALGADCDFAYDPQQIVNSKAEEAETFYENKKAQLEANTSSDDYEDATEEASSLSVVQDEAAALDVEDLVEDVETEAHDTLLDELIAAPWKDCHVSGDYSALIQLMSLLNPGDTRAQQAAQYCGTRLSATSADALSTSVGSMSAIGGVSASSSVNSGTIQVKKGGSLTLTGPIRALGCPQGSSSSEALSVSFDGHAISNPATGASPYLSGSLSYNINDLLTAAGLGNTAEDQLGSYNLTLTRSGETCGGFWGANPQPLLTVTLSLGSNICTPPSGIKYCVSRLLDSSGAEPYPDANPLYVAGDGTLLFSTASGYVIWRNRQFTALPIPAACVGVSGYCYTYNQVSAGGSYVGGNFRDSNGSEVAFVLKSSNNQVINLPQVNSVGAGVRAMNDNGDVAGYDYQTYTPPAGYSFNVSYTAVKWTAPGFAKTELHPSAPTVDCDEHYYPPFSSYMNASIAEAIASNGTSAGWTSTESCEKTSGNVPPLAAKFGAGTPTTVGPSNSAAYFMDDHGGVIYKTFADDKFHLVRDGQTTDLGSSVYGMGLNGQIHMRNASDQQIIYDSIAGTTLLVNDSLIAAGQGWSSVGPSAGKRFIDKQGRIPCLGYYNSVIKACMLTPAGVALP